MSCAGEQACQGDERAVARRFSAVEDAVAGLPAGLPGVQLRGRAGRAGGQADGHPSARDRGPSPLKTAARSKPTVYVHLRRSTHPSRVQYGRINTTHGVGPACIALHLVRVVLVPRVLNLGLDCSHGPWLC